MQLRATRQQGIALVLALALLVVVAGVATLMFARTLGEIRHSADDAAIVQSLLLARGAANLGGAVMTHDVRNELADIVEANGNTTSRWTFGTSNNTADAPDPDTVVTALTGAGTSVAAQLQSAIDAIVCGQSIDAAGAGSATLRIYVTSAACGLDLPPGVRIGVGRFVEGQPRNATDPNASQTYALPFVLVAEGDVASYRRNVVAQGEFRFAVGRGSFARYALFTNVHEDGSGGDVWFTDRTLFDGPVHTNQYFRFYRQPWFGGKVTSAGCRNPGADSCTSNNNRPGAEFYDEGFIRSNRMVDPTSPSYTNRYGTHAPDLTGGVDWESPFVPMPTNQQSQIDAAQDGGLYLGGDLDSLTMWAADDSGAPLQQQADGSWSPDATYQYIEACTPSGWVRQGRNWVYLDGGCTTYRSDAAGALYQQQDDGSWAVYRQEFNGVVYVNGGITRLRGPSRSPASSGDPSDAPPALASFAQITVASSADMRITGDLTYEDQPCSGAPERNQDGSVTAAVCDNLNAMNVLGLYTQQGSILIGNQHGDGSLNAPDNLKVDGVLMSGEGMVTVEDYNWGWDRGTINLLGGVIEYYYGAFGTFNASTGQNSTGYGRRFTYDQRMGAGLAPPYFPTVGGDALLPNSIVVYSFGQREQVY